MAIWLFRAGASGEHEQKFLSENRIQLTWDSLNINLISFKNKEELYPYLIEKYGLPKKELLIIGLHNYIQWPTQCKLEIG
ncbi:hypothetical protein B5P41_24765 [Bacillus sp. SRB_28]|nr:hypothetical protein B5P41_24765 [Bacillus sp. SRB_28]